MRTAARGPLSCVLQLKHGRGPRRQDSLHQWDCLRRLTWTSFALLRGVLARSFPSSFVAHTT